MRTTVSDQDVPSVSENESAHQHPLSDSFDSATVGLTENAVEASQSGSAIESSMLEGAPQIRACINTFNSQPILEPPKSAPIIPSFDAKEEKSKTVKDFISEDPQLNEKVHALRDMGFEQPVDTLIAALKKYKGDINVVVHKLVE